MRKTKILLGLMFMLSFWKDFRVKRACLIVAWAFSSGLGSLQYALAVDAFFAKTPRRIKPHRGFSGPL
jgi:hypothetical protein